MSWMEKLYSTYEAVYAKRDLLPGTLPVPPGCITPQAHIEVSIDEDGNFKSAAVIDKEPTLCPATEESAGRTSGGSPHPLCDKIQYCAGDYAAYGGIARAYFDDFESGGKIKDGYLSLLRKWNEFADHPMLKAVLRYSEKRCLIKDLISAGILFAGKDGRLLTEWKEKDTPQIFKVLPKKDSMTDFGTAFVRWKILRKTERCTVVWKCQELFDSWNRFCVSHQNKQDLCFVTGGTAPYALNHPANIRFPGDKAKLISGNDTSGYTFRGRFLTAEEACAVSYDVTQKAHSALRWLIERQSFRNDTQVIVSWAVSMAPIPKVITSTDAFFAEIDDVDTDSEMAPGVAADIGQGYALKLRNKIRGYNSKLNDRDDIVVMAIDSTVSGKGRMAVTYYREIKGSEFLARIEDYHKRYAWPQRFGKDKQFIGAPSIDDIAQSAYAGQPSPQLLKATISRLIPVVVDGAVMPRDIVQSVCRRACAPQSVEPWRFEKILGIACGLYAGSNPQGGYKMSLEEGKKTRDYLYGRLLAVADKIESHAISLGGESRDTSAIKLMQRFSEKPYTTWKIIEMNLTPYISRLRAKRESSLIVYNTLLDEIYSMFEPGMFDNNAPLTPEFLLGFHCQRRKLWEKANSDNNSDTSTSN